MALEGGQRMAAEPGAGAWRRRRSSGGARRCETAEEELGHPLAIISRGVLTRPTALGMNSAGGDVAAVIGCPLLRPGWVTAISPSSTRGRCTSVTVLEGSRAPARFFRGFGQSDARPSKPDVVCSNHTGVPLNGSPRRSNGRPESPSCPRCPSAPPSLEQCWIQRGPCPE